MSEERTKSALEELIESSFSEDVMERFYDEWLKPDDMLTGTGEPQRFSGTIEPVKPTSWAERVKKQR